MTLPPLIQALLKPEVYDHPTATIHCRQTHISWLILTGPYAYKIKKPVDFGFLDFSTLEKRNFYCHEELRLNRRLAPEIYLQVVRLTGESRSPRIDGPGQILEYAVKMIQFEEQDILAELAARDRLTEAQLENLAKLIADFHQRIDRAEAQSPYGEPEQIQEAALHNFSQIDPELLDKESRATLDQLHQWTLQTFQPLQSSLAARKAGGAIRECHGDLHLGNIVLWQGRPLPFDCIEFNPFLRWIDVISETAFTVMDLCARGLSPLGYSFINQYLSLTGDYPGVKLLRYYLVYRAMVRAKIAYLTWRQTEASEIPEDLHRYLHLARDFTKPSAPTLWICHGFSGSGKSYASRQLAAHLGAIHLRSDIERKRLAGLPATADSKAGLEEGLYKPDFTRRTYLKLREDADTILAAGFPVIVDATFLDQTMRRLFADLATERRVVFRILDFKAPEALLRQRIASRQQQRKDPSEADLQVLEYQLAHHIPLSPQEQAVAITFDTGRGFELPEALSALAKIPVPRPSPD